MKSSIQTKLIAMCVFLVLLATIGISATYYVLIKRDKHRESRQRVQIAFDIMFNDFTNRVHTYTTKFDEFLQENINLGWTVHSYNQDENVLSSASFIADYFRGLAKDMKEFGGVISADRLAVYGLDKRLLAVYQHEKEQETVGTYVVSQTNANTYLSFDDPTQISSILFGEQPIPDVPLPAGLVARYEGDIPDTVHAVPINERRKIGIRIVAPVYYQETKVGVLIGEVWYTQALIAEYASLSKTHINLFAGNLFSVGTLGIQKEFISETSEQIFDCERLMAGDENVDVFPVTFDLQDYYQGQCVFKNSQGTIGAVTVSLSQEIERQEIRKSLAAVLVVSGIVMGVAFVLSLLFSRRTINAIHNIVSVIGVAAEGDLRKTARVMTHDELGMLATKLNQMISQLHTISGQVQDASYAVNSTADTIFQEMGSLISYMEQQSASVDNTTGSVEKIKQFIDVVAHNTNDLLAAAAQILSSIQETRASIGEVTMSTESLTAELHLISVSVDQVNQAVKQIAEHIRQLEDVAQHAETEIHHIDKSFRDVGHNADLTQQLARETMEAATGGQSSVEVSIRGMTELKEVVSNTAQIIREVNSWGEQVSSILDIVDDITEQTSLLALNAAIISAQAGVHGRGFAVVADEIKELATRTKTSTQKIGALIHALQKKTEEGVHHMTEGLKKADQEMHVVNAVGDALEAILDSATRSSNRAADTVHVIQQTVGSCHTINTQMSSVTEMVAKIRTAIQKQEHDVGQVASAVENISGMSEQVNRASVEQKKAAEEIERSMEEVAEQFSAISIQTETLKQDSNQIVTAMHTIDSTTEQILQNALSISGERVKNLVQQSDMLQKIVNVFKVS